MDRRPSAGGAVRKAACPGWEAWGNEVESSVVTSGAGMSRDYLGKVREESD